MAMAEIDKGIRDVLELDQIFDSKSVILRAFQDSKASNAGGNDEYIGKKEFRVFLTKLRQVERLLKMVYFILNSLEHKKT